MKTKKHTEGFGLPKNYFQDFEDRLFSKIRKDQLPKKTGFTAPKGYFITIEEQIIKNAKVSETTPKVFSILSRKTWLYAASIAAVAVLIFSIINSTKNKITINTIEFSAIEMYIETRNEEFSTSQITSFLTNDDLAKLEIEMAPIANKILEEYLMENIDDSTILIEY